MRKIGWIGAGIMGQPMVIHLLNKGYEVHVYARHPERVEQAKNAGAILEESIVSLTSNVDVICTMVGFPSDVKEVYDVILRLQVQNLLKNYIQKEKNWVFMYWMRQ